MRAGAPERGDVLRVVLDPTMGPEQAGTRPVLVLTQHDFNRRGLALVCPITQGGEYARDAGFAVSLSGAGTETQGVVLCHQARSIAWKARGARYVEDVPQAVMLDVLARVAALIE